MNDATAILRDKLQQLIVMDKLEATDEFYVEFGKVLKEELEQTVFSKLDLEEINKLADEEAKFIRGDD